VVPARKQRTPRKTTFEHEIVLRLWALEIIAGKASGLPAHNIPSVIKKVWPDDYLNEYDDESGRYTLPAGFSIVPDHELTFIHTTPRNFIAVPECLASVMRTSGYSPLYIVGIYERLVEGRAPHDVAARYGLNLGTLKVFCTRVRKKMKLLESSKRVVNDLPRK
jgi:hypothetical protein